MSRPLNKRTLQSAAAATQDGNSLVVQGVGACALQITGTFSATITFEGTVNEDSSTWVAITGFNRNDGSISTTATAAGIWFFSVAGLHAIRARVSTYASGSVTVVGREVEGILPTSSRSLPNVEGTPGAAAPIKAVLIGARDGAGNLVLPTGGNWASDGRAASLAGMLVGAAQYVHNGATLDVVRGNTEGTLLASAARTATTDTPNQTNYNARGVVVTLDVTAVSGTGGLTLSVRTKDPVTAKPVVFLTAATAATAINTYTYVVYPDAAVAGGVTQASSLPLPRTWYVRVSHADGSSYTYSVGVQYIV